MHWDPDTIVIGSSGAKAFYVLGALRSLEKISKNVKGYVGSSSGALFSLLIVCGYSIDEIISKFIESPIFRDLNSFLPETEGIGKITFMVYEETIKEMVKAKFGFVPTMQRLYELTDLELSIVTCDITSGDTVYVTRQNHPTMPCTTAIYLSFDLHGPLYSTNYKNHVYIDGSFGNPYPADLVDDGSRNILGICVDYSTKKEDLVNKMHSTMAFPTEMLKRKIIRGTSAKCKNIVLTANFTDFKGSNTSRQERINMIKQGSDTVEKFKEELEEFNGDSFVIRPSDDLSKVHVEFQPDEQEIRKDKDEEDKAKIFSAIFAATMLACRENK